MNVSNLGRRLEEVSTKSKIRGYLRVDKYVHRVQVHTSTSMIQKPYVGIGKTGEFRILPNAFNIESWSDRGLRKI